MTTAPTTTLWATLGIGATDDRAAIRRAYAARLKVVQPEDDPEGFKQLRAAYEQAMAMAERAAALAASAAAEAAALLPETARSTDLDAPLVTDDAHDVSAPESMARPPPAQPLVGRPAHHAAHEAACNRLRALLTAQNPPTADELDQALAAVLTSPALDELSTHLQTEGWLARLICHTAPRSDAIVERAAAAFGWKPDALYVADPAIGGAIARLSALGHSRLLAQLDAMLRGPAEPEENKLFGLLDRLTAPGVIRHPQQGPQIEVALARMLLQTRPGSDPVIPVVVRRLGWAAPARQATADPAIVEAAKLAGQIAPHRPAPAPVRSGGAPRRFFGSIWVVLLVVGGLSYCASQVARLASYQDASRTDASAGSQAQSASTGPRAAIFKDHIDMSVSSTTSGFAELVCFAGDGRLRDCSVVSATNGDKAEAARYLALHLVLPQDDRSGPAVGDRIPVHMSFHGV